ncbi:MAG: nucleotidyltransferase domain-containing protein [Pseudomonas sp.]|uniref:nucleotidyltransferase domain-containing protein n=1 Tax=Pseudomonas sp. TaxID=306 RepID=UPI0030F064FB
MTVLDSLFGIQRQRVLGWLLLHPDEQVHVRELARITHTNAGSLHRELARLAEGGLLVRSQQGNQVLYQANRSHPVFAELAGLFRKTSGVVGVLQEALLPLSTQIKLAWVFGSVARGEENADSDVDVLLIGETSFTDLVRALHPYQALLGREINPVLYAPEEFTRKLNEGDLFARELLEKPRLFIQGVEDDIGELTRH